VAFLAKEDERQQAAAVKHAANFRDGILAALHAAEENDPFASIRGGFDLSASDSRQWKTSLKLPDADRCVLLKTPAQAPSVNSAWTFACIFTVHLPGPTLFPAQTLAAPTRNYESMSPMPISA